MLSEDLRENEWINCMGQTLSAAYVSAANSVCPSDHQSVNLAVPNGQ
jgi:hypothetical protein